MQTTSRYASRTSASLGEGYSFIALRFGTCNKLKSLIMKKISMIELSRRAMGAREMNALTGGNVCGCGCHGPSSTQANANANYKGNKSSNGSQSVVIADMSDGQVEVHNP